MGVPFLRLDRTCPQSLPGHASPEIEAEFKLGRQSRGSMAASCVHGRRPASPGEMHVEKQTCCTRSQVKAGNSTWNETQELRAKRVGNNRTALVYAYIFHWSPFHLCLLLRGLAMRSLPALIIKSIWFRQKKKSGMKIARPQTRGGVAVETRSDPGL